MVSDSMLSVKVMLDPGAIFPKKAHDDDAGFDLCLPTTYHDGVTVYAGESVIIDTGVHFQIPHGCVGFLKSKSGLNFRAGLTGEGVIDSGYTGAVSVKLYSAGEKESFHFEPGDKLIQIVFLPIPDVQLQTVEAFPETERGAGGFGSSGR